ncbi:hypothetical protein Fcan01_20319 [Folsomia candida]|uniref:Uncharacterized protein n=1 Tax=Folsomia candida TaxID=158441 RepID=A0A226DK02_FOLCA|nr:hypothetical protein Fcan01_20319 [Folsomia candida]
MPALAIIILLVFFIPQSTQIIWKISPKMKSFLLTVAVCCLLLVAMTTAASIDQKTGDEIKAMDLFVSGGPVKPSIFMVSDSPFLEKILSFSKMTTFYLGPQILATPAISWLPRVAKMLLVTRPPTRWPTTRAVRSTKTIGGKSIMVFVQWRKKM